MDTGNILVNSDQTEMVWKCRNTESRNKGEVELYIYKKKYPLNYFKLHMQRCVCVQVKL